MYRRCPSNSLLCIFIPYVNKINGKKCKFLNIRSLLLSNWCFLFNWTLVLAVTVWWCPWYLPTVDRGWPEVLAKEFLSHNISLYMENECLKLSMFYFSFNFTVPFFSASLLLFSIFIIYFSYFGLRKVRWEKMSKPNIYSFVQHLISPHKMVNF